MAKVFLHLLASFVVSNHTIARSPKIVTGATPNMARGLPLLNAVKAIVEFCSDSCKASCGYTPKANTSCRSGSRNSINAISSNRASLTLTTYINLHNDRENSYGQRIYLPEEYAISSFIS